MRFKNTDLIKDYQVSSFLELLESHVYDLRMESEALQMKDPIMSMNINNFTDKFTEEKTDSIYMKHRLKVWSNEPGIDPALIEKQLTNDLIEHVGGITGYKNTLKSNQELFDGSEYQLFTDIIDRIDTYMYRLNNIIQNFHIQDYLKNVNKDMNSELVEWFYEYETNIFREFLRISRFDKFLTYDEIKSNLMWSKELIDTRDLYDSWIDAYKEVLYVFIDENIQATDSEQKEMKERLSKAIEKEFDYEYI